MHIFPPHLICQWPSLRLKELFLALTIQTADQDTYISGFHTQSRYKRASMLDATFAYPPWKGTKAVAP